MSEDVSFYPPLFWQSVQIRQQNGERFGQAVFNSAYGLFPAEVGKIVASEIDPFYNDSRVDRFLTELENRLKQPGV